MLDENPYQPPSDPVYTPVPGWTRSHLGIHGTDGMTDEELARQLEAGGRFVVFDYCISVIFMTFQKSSKDIHFVAPGQIAAFKGLPYTLLSLVAGWWGFPWGFIFTPIVIIRNLLGGRDVTQAVVVHLLRWDERQAVQEYLETRPSPLAGRRGLFDDEPAKPEESTPDAIKNLRL